MPVHDWTRVDAGLFHDFHQGWAIALRNALNAGVLPSDYFALVEQNIRGPLPNVLILRLSPETGEGPEPSVGVYARKADRITVRHKHGGVVAVIEIVSPGNKGSRNEPRAFVQKASDLIQQGIHLLVIDLFPPSKRDPQGIHKAIWDEIQEEDFELPTDKPLTLAAYVAGPVLTAYVELVAVGDALPDMPLFLRPEFYVPVPLEAAYQATWNVFPAPLKGLLEGPA